MMRRTEGVVGIVGAAATAGDRWRAGDAGRLAGVAGDVAGGGDAGDRWLSREGMV